MNWTNYDRLVQHLKTMPPDMFDYSIDSATLDRPGCVECQCRVLMGDLPYRIADTFREFAIARFLQVDENEVQFLYTGYVVGDPCESRKGNEGIANALHRLQVVASRYTRPVKSVNSEINPSMDARERAHLLRCMAVAAEPVEVE